jgi:hypothetical protein
MVVLQGESKNFTLENPHSEWETPNFTCRVVERTL